MVSQTYMMFQEMLKWGIEANNLALLSIFYELLARGRVWATDEVLEKIEKPDVSQYYGLTKGLLRLTMARKQHKYS